MNGYVCAVSTRIVGKKELRVLGEYVGPRHPEDWQIPRKISNTNPKGGDKRQHHPSISKHGITASSVPSTRNFFKSLQGEKDMNKKRLRKKRMVQALLPTVLMILIAGVTANAALMGDLNNDDNIDLADAITGMKVLTDQTADGVNSDKKIGIADVVYVLKMIVPLNSVEENFDEEQAKPEHWTVFNSGTVGWKFDDPGGRSNTTGGSENFAIADSDVAGQVDMDTELRTPVMDFSDAASVRLTFKTHFVPYETSKASVGVSIDEGINWTDVWEQTETELNATVSLDLSEQAAGESQVMVRFRYYDANWSYYWELDEVNIEGISAVTTAPEELTATAEGTVITLTWSDNSDNATTFKIERSASADSGFAEIGTSGKNRTNYKDQTGLSCNTTYYYRVSAGNTAGYSDASNTADATTGECSKQQTSLNETFDSGSLPEGWTVETTSGTGWVFNNPNNRDAYTTGNFAIADPGNIVGASADSELRTPVLNLTDYSGVSLSFTTFYWHGKGSAKVEVSTDSGNNWTHAWQQTADIYYNPIKEETIDLSDAIAGKSDVMIRFHADIGNSSQVALWGVDDVKLETVESVPAPSAPTALGAVLESSGAVKLSWEGNGAGNFEIERSAGGETSYAKVGEISDTTYADNSVEGNTTYYYKVRASNTAGTSDYSDSVSITTEDRSVVTYDITVSYYDTPTNTVAKKTALEENIRYFADAVYESSNGVNKIGRVTIYTNGGWSDKADIVWVESCWPNAYISGYAAEEGPYKRIEMCDDFSGTNFLEGDNTKQGGYVMAHEWGHYFYSLYDEYQGTNASSDYISAPLSGDTPSEPSVMNNQWRAVDDLDWLNFSTSESNTGNNAQYRVYGASAWETLIRPLSEDPRDGQRSIMPERIYHEEMKNAAPSSGVVLDINTEEHTARSELNIVWADLDTSGKRYDVTPPGGVARIILIDCSAGISQERLDDIKRRMKDMVDEAKIGDAVGIIAFDFMPEVLYDLKTIERETEKAAIKDVIDSIQVSDSSANISAALAKALDEITTKVPDTVNRVVCLITPGSYDEGDHPFLQIPGYEENFVRLFTFGFGAEEGDAGVLEEMAEQTGGNYHFIGNGDDLHKAIGDAVQDTSPIVAVNVKTGVEDDIAMGATYERPFYVDSTLGEFAIYLSFFSDEENAASVALTDPEGKSYEISADEYESYADEWGIETVIFHLEENPSVGEWTVGITAKSDLFYLYYWVDGEMKAGDLMVTANVRSVTGDTIIYPDPILLSASVGKNFTITNVGISGSVEYPDGEIRTFDLTDDGIAPDYEANDGIYAALIDPTENGDYYITVSFDNSEITAEYTDYAAHFAPNIDGSVRVHDKWAVDENFERFAEVQVNVSGVQGDDHSDWYNDHPTILHPNNMPLPGKIDFAGDIDTFKITLPQNYPSGETIIRVDNLGMGMDPYLYIFAEDWSWEVDKFFDTEPTRYDSLVFPVFVMPGETFYVEVWHFEGETGLYNISAGPRLKSEVSPEERPPRPDSPPEP